MVSRIVLDPGHGGTRTGCVKGIFIEKDFTLQIAQYIHDIAAMSIALTRTSDSRTPPKLRAQIVEKIKPDFVISIHADSNPDSNVCGMRIYHLKDDTAAIALAYNILEVDSTFPRLTVAANRKLNREGAIIETKIDPTHWTKRANNVLQMYRNYNPVLIECGFCTNDNDRLWMLSEEGQRSIAWSIHEGARSLILRNHANSAQS